MLVGKCKPIAALKVTPTNSGGAGGGKKKRSKGASALLLTASRDVLQQLSAEEQLDVIEKLQDEVGRCQRVIEVKNAFIQKAKEAYIEEKKQLRAVSELVPAPSPTQRMHLFRPLVVKVEEPTVDNDRVFFSIIVKHGAAPEPYKLPGRPYSLFRAARNQMLQAAYADAAPHLSMVPFCSDNDAVEVQTLERLQAMRFPKKAWFGNLDEGFMQERRAALEEWLSEVVQVCRLANRGSSVRKFMATWLEIDGAEDAVWRSALPLTAVRQ